ncbi:sporulation phosphorelay system protein KapB [Thalassorhabdus alkalitolerans]|uniref:Sporulation phosphorelay system protein KapB n=1 Tax=Thalassorhabdus alkalitolerans TaxID=2282697 RepID=A0ABW0YQ88_9BACI
MAADAKIIQAPYKTGVYVGEEIDQKGEKTLVKVRAVLKHPKQGDLHNPKQVDVPLFHERKALAEFEKVWVQTDMLRKYDEEPPDYKKSLKHAVEKEKDLLREKNDEWSQKALETLETVENDYKL